MKVGVARPLLVLHDATAVSRFSSYATAVMARGGTQKAWW